MTITSGVNEDRTNTPFAIICGNKHLQATIQTFAYVPYPFTLNKNANELTTTDKKP
jgi:hypothetical protein